MAVTAVVFDLAETLVDETRHWDEVADEAGATASCSPIWVSRRCRGPSGSRATVLAAPWNIAYIGDRVDNDVLPALDAGMVAVHIRRGPWGRRHTTPPGAIVIDSLHELPGVFA